MASTLRVQSSLVKNEPRDGGTSLVLVGMYPRCRSAMWCVSNAGYTTCLELFDEDSTRIDIWICPSQWHAPLRCINGRVSEEFKKVLVDLASFTADLTDCLLGGTYNAANAPVLEVPNALGARSTKFRKQSDPRDWESEGWRVVSHCLGRLMHVGDWSEHWKAAEDASAALFPALQASRMPKCQSRCAVGAVAE